MCYSYPTYLPLREFLICHAQPVSGTHQHQFINSLVQSGRYTSTSEIVRDALRKLEGSQGSEWLLSQLIEGEKGEAQAWDDKALLAHVKKEALKRGNL